MRYELIHEIFNQCSNNQMRDVFVSELDTDDTDLIAQRYCTGQNVSLNKSTDGNVLIYDIVADGLRQRLTFTPDD